VRMLLIRFLQEYRVELSNYVIDQVPLMKSAQDSNSPILIEGANALMLDLDFGTYPYVTSVSASSAEYPIYVAN
jgi:adenylosuccinate synthase